ncbi:MAG: hypothetical protein M1832_004803 [Thelocarpon impressellum]|nr:MAG: hypothetical protein M1832_004803 [Thelocarpon impressellum]
MLSSLILFALAAAGLAVARPQSATTPVTGKVGDALVVASNPVGAFYKADLPASKKVKGYITGVSNNGTGVYFSLSVSNLPTSGGPFLYHIHDAPVPADGNCTGTLAHLDPTVRGEKPECDPKLPQTCQTGDLSGKYGKITSDPYTRSYTDLFASTLPGIGAFFGNRSITIHYANATRITCANFVLVDPAATPTPSAPYAPSASDSSYGGVGSNSSVTPPGVVPFTGAASSARVAWASVLVGLGGVAAAALML